MRTQYMNWLACPLCDFNYQSKLWTQCPNCSTKELYTITKTWTSNDTSSPPPWEPIPSINNFGKNILNILGPEVTINYPQTDGFESKPIKQIIKPEKKKKIIDDEPKEYKRQFEL